MTTTQTIDEATEERIGPALGRISSGVYIVTTGQGSERDGMLTTWINQISFHPPMLALSVAKERAIAERMRKGERLTVNVLGKPNSDIFKAFAKPHAEGMDRFEGLELVDDLDGPPALASCLSCLSCEVVEVSEPGDHMLVAARVLDGRMLNAGIEPMLHTRKNGFQY